ncbi:MAG: DsrE/DsrF/DrsH-like family protein [Myxococcota bacterium]|jgi:peroxiredoxin family protein|nr:DsrE/DsrF/DrsH-like family protein [Myxococcota bacterium]
MTPTDLATQLIELKSQVDHMAPGPKNKLSMIVFSGDMDKLLASMIIATSARAMGMEVVQFYTFWGTAALRNPSAKVPGKDLLAHMFGWMLPNGRGDTKFSQMHMAGMGTALLKDLMKKKNAPTLDQLFEVAAALGVRIQVCEMTMDLLGFKREEIIDYPNLEYCGVATFLSHAKESSVHFFI